MKATFGAGCFWCVEDIFRNTKGVTSTQVGYAGGWKKNPTYEEVCTDTTGHAEVVQVEYDPDQISYKQLLDVFWGCHDPTTLNRQGPDIGKQYRSVIFCHDSEQERVANESMKKIQDSGKYARKIVTEIKPAPAFYRAEEYHQQYYAKCSIR
ncbi:MAG: peptide-methionine (S)-S-oxide reductase MsrA [Candidatus Nitrosotenuis sp.]|uniref:Peptide methionine sulfoxide reductase MsrA n=1 Tax=Candidatus Nitrosotenuis uzonensis TaxID=1407055 RepID=A0A812F6G4_9ARCH|nr:peptide-methionine (S)-S-oxide reductase MsrA [Candidatus Nitrosotenuis uzonensis]CAE6500219.1 Peptide methionine sulfoxide reductase MsrA [Candidatus Nitrosotenuis uzonensis]